MGRFMIPVCCVCGKSAKGWDDEIWQQNGGLQDFCPEHKPNETEQYIVEHMNAHTNNKQRTYTAMTDHEKYECARRELVMRMRVYPKWVESGRMKQETADREIELMAAIADDYRAKAEPSLFDEDTQP